MFSPAKCGGLIEAPSSEPGRVGELSRHDPTGRDRNERQEGSAEFFITRGTAAEGFKLIDESFHLLARGVLFLVVLDCPGAIRSGGNQGFDAPPASAFRMALASKALSMTFFRKLQRDSISASNPPIRQQRLIPGKAGHLALATLFLGRQRGAVATDTPKNGVRLWRSLRSLRPSSRDRRWRCRTKLRAE